MNPSDIERVALAREAVAFIRAFPSDMREVEGRITEFGARGLDRACDEIDAALNAMAEMPDDLCGWRDSEIGREIVHYGRKGGLRIEPADPIVFEDNEFEHRMSAEEHGAMKRALLDSVEVVGRIERPPVSNEAVERAKRVIAEQPNDLTLEQVTAQRDLWIISASDWEARLVQLQNRVRVLEENIVELWHETEAGRKDLHEYLGFNWKEYQDWVANGHERTGQ